MRSRLNILFILLAAVAVFSHSVVPHDHCYPRGNICMHQHHDDANAEECGDENQCAVKDIISQRFDDQKPLLQCVCMPHNLLSDILQASMPDSVPLNEGVPIRPAPYSGSCPGQSSPAATGLRAPPAA